MSAAVSKSTHPYKRFADGTELVIDVYSPQDMVTGATRPAVVLFHGGGWSGGTRDQFFMQCQRLCELGLICLTPQYRARNSHGTPPQTALSDAKSAMRWIFANAGQLSIDPSRIAAGGGSAGAHLAAASLMCPGFDDPADDLSVIIRPAALILFNPVTNNGPEGYGYTQIKDDFPAFSPAHNIRAGLPPTIIYLGTKDDLIPVEVCKAFESEMQSAGNDCKLILYEGAEHGFFNYGEGNDHFYQQTLDRTIDFIKGLGWLSFPES